jgi:hypothetical protein
MALHDFFAERQLGLTTVQEYAWENVRDLTNASNPMPAVNKVETIASIANIADQVTKAGSFGEDQWALQYISVFRVQPLIEALDDDVSSFISIAEVNAFTSGRPHDWRYVFTFIHCKFHIN